MGAMKRLKIYHELEISEKNKEAEPVYLVRK